MVDLLWKAARSSEARPVQASHTRATATACQYIGDKRDNPKKRLDIVLQYQTATQVSKLDRTYLPILSQLFDDEDEIDKERQTNEFREVVGGIVILESSLIGFASWNIHLVVHQ